MTGRAVKLFSHNYRPVQVRIRVPGIGRPHDDDHRDIEGHRVVARPRVVRNQQMAPLHEGLEQLEVDLVGAKIDDIGFRAVQNGLDDALLTGA